MKLFSFVMLALLFGGCATSTRQTDQLVKDNAGLTQESRLRELEHVEQESNFCGPASLTMVFNYLGRKTTVEEMTAQSFTAQAEGTFQADMLSTARHHGLLTLPVQNMKSLIEELSAGHPVIVFQNLAFSWSPQWHYAVVSGHDLSGPDVYLHTGDEKFKKTDMRFFERSWKLGGYWGLVLLTPGQLSASGSELEHTQAAALLEQLGKTTEASISYEGILKRWPHSLTALIGLGNITYTQNKISSSVSYLEKAVEHHPESAIAWHNLTIALAASGKHKEAKLSAQKAIKFADTETRKNFKVSLQKWL